MNKTVEQSDDGVEVVIGAGNDDNSTLVDAATNTAAKTRPRVGNMVISSLV